MEGFFQMISSKRRQEIGRLIRERRKDLGIDQVALGIDIWGSSLKPGAMQSRMSRIERGETWTDYHTIISIISALELWDEIFEPLQPENYSDTIIEPELERYVPDIRDSLNIMNRYAKQGIPELVYRQLDYLCDAPREQSKNSNL